MANVLWKNTNEYEVLVVFGNEILVKVSYKNTEVEVAEASVEATETAVSL